MWRDFIKGVNIVSIPLFPPLTKPRNRVAMPPQERPIDWDLNPQDLPMSVMAIEFKNTVDASMMSLVEEQGITIPPACDVCDETLVVAIAKKQARLGEIYVNVCVISPRVSLY